MAEYSPQAAKGDECYLFLFSGLEAHAGAGGNVEMHTERLVAIERKGAIHFEEMIVTSYLNGTVSGMSHQYSELLAALVGDDRVRCEQVFAWES